MRTMRMMLVVLAAASAEGAEFRKTPSTKAEGDGAVISFEAAEACDVAVLIVDGAGRPVRHLAAGVLGEHAPPPLKAGSLEQALVWDGNGDDGKPVPRGQYKARVGLGLKVAFDRFVGNERQRFEAISALAVGPGGELYVYDAGQIVVLDREGRYQRQILPHPAGLPAEKLAGLNPVTLDDGTVFSRRRYPDGKGFDKVVGSMAISPDGKMLYLPGPPRYARNLTRIGTDGSVPPDAFSIRLTTHADNGYLNLVCSPDGKMLYMAGAMAGYMGDDTRNLTFRQSIYRLKLDSPGPAETWVGDDENSARRWFSVGNPKGVATDPAGRVYVANYRNDDVAVYTPGGGFIRKFDVKFPHQVAVNPKTGNLYVLAGRETSRFQYNYQYPEMMHEARIVHFSPEGKVEKELVLDPPHIVTRKDPETGQPLTQPEFNLRMTVDFSQPDRPVVWVGVAAPSAIGAKWGLLRIEDLGNRFGEPRDVCDHGPGAVRGLISRMALDRSRDILYIAGGDNRLYRYNALDGSPMQPLSIGDEDRGKQALKICEHAVAPDGTIYLLAFTDTYRTGRIYRATPEGRLLPFSGGQPTVEHMLKGAGAGTARGFAVSAAGEIFVLYFDDTNRPDDKAPVELWDRCCQFPTALAKFAPDGSVADMHLIHYLRSGAQGVRIDSRGNIYVADNFMPVGVTYPAELAKVMPDDPLKRPYPARLPDATFDPFLRWMGCLLKFPPTGGRIAGMPEREHYPPADRPQPGDLFRAPLPTQWFVHNLHRLQVTGALWQFHGIAPVPAEYQGVTHVERCVCVAGRFDIDPFDRLFVPDTIRHRFTVLDSNGNVICRFGQYGNRDDSGLRFNHAAYVAADSDYAFIGDTGSRRLVRAKFTYAAVAECELTR